LFLLLETSVLSYGFATLMRGKSLTCRKALDQMLAVSDRKKTY